MSAATASLGLIGIIVLLSIPLSILGAPHFFGELPFSVKQPTLAMELIQDKSQVDQILRAGTEFEHPNRLRMRIQTYIDIGLFIPAYVMLFGCLAIMAAPDFSLLARLAVLLILGAAVADYMEDAGILSALGSGLKLQWTRPASLVKWGCLFASAAALAPWWLTRIHWFDRLGGLALALSGLWGIWASAAANERHIEFASVPLLIALIAVAWHGWRLRLSN